MTTLLNLVLYLSLFVHVFLIAICVWRVWQGENVIDRLMGVELMSTFTLSILVLTSLIQGRMLFMDVALGLAALSFIGTIAMARYLAQDQMF